MVPVTGELYNLHYSQHFPCLLYTSHVFTKEELFREIWDMDSIGDIATVTVHIKKIREKIEKDLSLIHI